MIWKQLLLVSLFFLGALLLPKVSLALDKAPKCWPMCSTDWRTGACYDGLPIRGIPCRHPNADYCPPDAYFYRYNPATNKCESLGASDTFTCVSGSCDTAIGSIPVGDLSQFLTFVLKYTFALSGGIILLMVIVTGYTILTAAGNPEKLQAAKENIVAIFSGLLLIAFSLVILRTLGADILGLPTF
jgi:hypothetical protein